MKILIADDEIRIVDILRSFLKDKDCLVDYALDGEKALRLIKEQDYDVVFLDFNMPKLTGIEINKYITENHIKIKVVFLTGYPELNERFIRALGVDEYLEKPIDLKVIGEIIEKYRPEKEK